MSDINLQLEIDHSISVVGESYVEQAEAWAVGQRNGTPVQDTDETYHNNAKYYAEQAASSESNAASSESNAQTYAGNAETSAGNALASKQSAASSAEDAEAWAVGRRGGVDVGSTDPAYQNNAKYYAQHYAPGENLFALTRSVEGYINADGGVAAPGAETQERVSEYIAVTPGDAMAYQCWVNVPAGSIPWAAYCFYDSGRAKTGSVVAVTDATSTASDGSKYIAQTFTVPSGAAYIRVSFRTFGAARAKLEVNSAPTLYVVNKADYLALQQINDTRAGKLVDTATGTSVAVVTDAYINAPLISVSEAGATSQDGTPTPSSPVAIEGLAGYDTMTVSGGVYAYSRSAAFDASADQYYAVQVEDGSGNTTWIGTTEKIAPLYAGDSIDFAVGRVTRKNLLMAFSNDDIRSTGSSSAGLRYFSAATPGGIALAQTTESNPYPKCDRAVSSPTASVANSIRATQDGATVYYVYGTSDDTDATLREKFGGAKILLRRKNQVTETVPMSSDLSGIYGYLTLTGSGTLTVRYAADLKTYIDNAIANALNA